MSLATLPRYVPTSWTPMQAQSVPPWGAKAFRPGPAVYATLRGAPPDE